MPPTSFTRVVLAERPKEQIIPEKTFKPVTVSFDELKPGPSSVVVKVNYVSLDPAMRGWLNDTRSYIEPVKIGEAMRAAGIATVVSTGPGSAFRTGDLVTGTVGWQEYAVVPDKGLEKITVPPGAELLDFLSALSMPGLTAYFGLLDVGKIKAGETLVVTGAAGATGSLVCQFGKLKGAKVIAIAGGQEKCQWLRETLNVDMAIDYKSKDFHKECKKFGYFDVLFDNVGGEMLEFMLTRMNKGARIVLCGSISQYNTKTPYGLKTYMNLISQRAKIEGFIVFDYAKQWKAALAEIAGWLAQGTVQRKFHVVDGLQNAPAALLMLFNGANTGKLIVKVAEPDATPLKGKL